MIEFIKKFGLVNRLGEKVSVFIMIGFSTLLTNCGIIAGGSNYNAHVIVNDRPKTKIIYQGVVMGIKNASFSIKRSRADKFAFTLREEGCPDQTYNYRSKSFRGWALAGSLFTWGWTGVAVDFIAGSLWKPSLQEKGIFKTDYKNFVYSVSYNECQKTEINFENLYLIDIVYLKDGRILKGVIVEQVPSVSIKIQITDGSVLTFKVSEIEKMERQ